MALGATVFRTALNVADVDRHYYADHALTLARHSSETDERLMVRVLAFALHAHERLEFGRGIGAAEEPDLWQRDLTGRIECWIDVGQPEVRRVRKALGVADRVVVYAFGGRTTDLWWAKAEPDLAGAKGLSVIALAGSTTAELATWASRSMELQMTIQDGEAWFSNGDARVLVERRWLVGA